MAFSGHNRLRSRARACSTAVSCWSACPRQGGGEMIDTVTFEKTTYAKLPFKFEAGTPHIAGIIGLGEAIRWMEDYDKPAMATA